jgi:hypothetical protein
LLSRVLPISAGPASVPPQLRAYASKLPSLKEELVSPIKLGGLVCDNLIYEIENAPLTNHEAPGLSFPAPEGFSRIRRDLGIGTSKEEQR